jgi:ribosome-binding factor A
MPSIRPERVAAEIQAAVADLLTRGAIHDPRIGFITLTGVKVSPDLSVAQVFYSMIGSDEL